jgi:hypothetical protein
MNVTFANFYHHWTTNKQTSKPIRHFKKSQLLEENLEDRPYLDLEHTQPKSTINLFFIIRNTMPKMPFYD